MPGRLTIGLWNSYDPRRFVEAHRRALARAGGLALAFDASLASFGFPYDDLAAGGGRTAERRGTKARDEPRRGEDLELDLTSPEGIARHVAASTSIGEGGALFVELAQKGRFHPLPLPKGGYPPQLGRPILTTSKVDPRRKVGAADLAAALERGESLLLVFGLGPHGPGQEARDLCKADFDVTGRGASLETATALGACVAAVAFARPSRNERP